MNEDELKKALHDPHSKVMAVKLTDEMKERLSRICDEIIDELTKRTQGPGEAFMVLHFVMETLKEEYGVAGAFVKNEDEHGAA
jgi:hypothetical protein